MKTKKSEKGQAGLEFVITMPVFLLALFLITIIGNQLYQKLSSQAFTYSHCMWEVRDVKLRPLDGTAFSMIVNETKKTWNTEGLWESYPVIDDPRGSYIDIGSQEKVCVGSVTYDEWHKVGFGYLLTYDPDVLVESKLVVLKPLFMNVEDRLGVRGGHFYWDWEQ